MEPIAIVVLLALLLLIISTTIIIYRLYVTKMPGRLRTFDVILNFVFIIIIGWFFTVIPFNTYTTNVNKNSTTITTQETIIRHFVVFEADTLFLSEDRITDTISTGILSDSLNLKIETTHTLFGRITKREILE